MALRTGNEFGARGELFSKILLRDRRRLSRRGLLRQKQRTERAADACSGNDIVILDAAFLALCRLGGRGDRSRRMGVADRDAHGKPRRWLNGERHSSRAGATTTAWCRAEKECGPGRRATDCSAQSASQYIKHVTTPTPKRLRPLCFQRRTCLATRVANCPPRPSPARPPSRTHTLCRPA